MMGLCLALLKEDVDLFHVLFMKKPRSLLVLYVQSNYNTLKLTTLCNAN